MQKLTRSLFALGVLAGLAACGDDVSVTEPPPIVPAVTGISVSPGSATLIKGQTAQLSAVVTANDPSVATTVTWASSNAAVATVSATGLVTAVNPGAATVTATSTANANFRAGAQITVSGSGVRSIRVAPDNAIVPTGSTLQLVANVDADAGVARTVTWTSSNAAVASVSTTGVVTGLTAGNVTITAASTVDATVTGAAAITVRNPIPATISISNITTGGLGAPVNINNTFGQIEVTLNVEPGDQIISKVDVLIDGTVAGSQSFTVSRNEELALSHVFENVQAAPVTISINTARFNQTTGVPDFLNGTRALSARATLQGGTSVATPSTNLIFNNANGIVMPTETLGGTSNSATSSAGLLFRRGSLSVSIIPVIYSSGLSMQSGTVSFGSGCDTFGEGVRTVALVAPTTGSTWTATFSQTNVTGTQNDVFSYEFGPTAACTLANPRGEMPRISATDNAGNPLYATMPPSDSLTRQGIRLDNRAPSAPTFIANPNNRQNGWINGSVGLTGRNGTDVFPGVPSITDNDWLANGPTADQGVGGYNRMLRIGDGSAGTVAAANAATASATQTLPAPSVANNSLCAVATATDALGNESALPSGTTSCFLPPFASFTSTGTQHLRFGVDINPPTIGFFLGLTSGQRVAAATLGAEFQVTVADTGAVGNSGMLSGAAVIGTVQLRTATATTCVLGTIPTGGGCTGISVHPAPPFPLVPTMIIAAQGTNGYYTYDAIAQDAAGNASGPVNRVVVLDDIPATATNPAVPVTITGAFSASAFLNDDLSIRDYFYTVGYGGFFPQTITLAAAPTDVDAFNSATLTNTNFAINTTVNTFLELQNGTTGVPAAYAAGASSLNALNLFARDQAQVAYTAASSPIAATAPATGVSIVNFTAYASATSNATICAGTLTAGCGTTPTTTNLTAVATGTTAVFNNPFSRVDFYGFNGTNFVLLGSVPSGSATLVDNGSTRVWTYTFALSGSAAGTALGTSVTRAIAAFGVSAAGNVALVSPPVAQTINP